MKVLYKFGGFFIDPQSKLLIKENKPVQIKPKVFDTLLVLVEGRGNVLSKDDLMEKIWSDTSVEENNLQQNISILRKVLGETEDGKQYIETLPKRGYRFAATIEEIADDDALVVEKRTHQRIIIDRQPKLVGEEKNVTPQAVEAIAVSQEAVGVLPEAQGRPLALKWKLAAGTAMVLVLVAGVMAVRQNPKWFRAPQSNRNFVLKPTKTFGLKNEGEETAIMNGKLSPDGKMIAYAIYGANRSENILVKVLDTDYVQALTKEASKNWDPLWSADGSEIAFLSDRGDQKGIWKVHHLGGAATLIRYLDPPSDSAAHSNPMLQSWSEDRRTLYYVWDENFFALDIASQEITQLTHFDPEQVSIRGFQISPDKEWIAYTDRKENQTDIWKVSIRGGAPIRITNDADMESKLVWSVDGRSLIYSASQDGLHRLSRIDLLDGQATDLLSGIEAGDLADISSDGSKLLYRIRKDESDLWKVNVQSGEEQKITSELGLEFWPDVSPDGMTVAFQAVPGSNYLSNQNLCMILTKSLAADSQAVQIADSASQAQWSPDGKNLAFLHMDKGISTLQVIRSIGGIAKQVAEGNICISGFTPSPYNHTNDYSWSPDGSKLTYIAKRGELQNLWVASIDGPGEVRLSNHTDAALVLANPFWSPDGKRIAYVSDDYKNPRNGKRVFQLWMANLENPENSEMVFQTESSLKLVGWSGESELVVGLIDKKIGTTGAPCDMEIYRLNGKNAQKIADLKSAYFDNLRLSPDKKSVAFVAIQDKKSNLYTCALKGGEIKQISKNTDLTTLFSSPAWSPDSTFLCYGRQERINSFTIYEGLK
jgi:Tol biopolymer transport system component/DNA-binding winged helix-turn-helix (wHTH) protein